MPTTTNKQRVITQIFTTLKKHYEPREPEPRPVLEQFLYAICRESASRAQADRVFRNLQERFFDWNEIRVSSPREVEEALGSIPDADTRANRLIGFLQEVFETTFSFDLESLHKKGLKQAAKQLGRYQAANDYAVSWVIQHSLGGHALPLDGPSLGLLRRLGLLDGSEGDLEAMRTSLEHLIPKSRGPLFIELISAMAHDPSWEEQFDRLPRSLHSDCAESEGSAAPPMVERINRPKPR
jgi:endonuclease III